METLKLIIAGKETESPKRFSSRNYRGEVISQVHMAEDGEIEKALEAVDRAFESLSKTPAHLRQDGLRKAADLLEQRAEDFARIIAQEVSKPIRLARGEVSRAVKTLRLTVSAMEEAQGEIVRLDTSPGHPHKTGLVRMFPKGPVLAIVPFNFPLNLAMHKIAPAVAVGAPFILKPPSAAPITGLMLGRLFLDAGVPPEAVSVLPAPSSLAEKMALDHRIKVVSFTGSSPVGWRLRQMAPKKTVLLELGGNAACLIHRDADMELAVQRCIVGSYAYSGQVCISIQRIMVHEDIYRDFVQMFSEKAGALKTGDPLQDDTDIGPMITESEAKRVEEWVNEALEKGGKLLFGGRRDRSFYQATAVENPPRNSRLWTGEVFGPVATVEPVKDFQQGLRLVNDSEFGLQAGVFTRDINLAMQAFETIEVGGVILNDMPTFRVDRMPYGGVKSSGNGREGPHYTMREFCETRLMVI